MLKDFKECIEDIKYIIVNAPVVNLMLILGFILFAHPPKPSGTE